MKRYFDITFLFFLVFIMICGQKIIFATAINHVYTSENIIHPITKQQIGLNSEKIPESDQKSLDNLFRNLITSQLVGYVIFVDKPMAWGDFYTGKICVDLQSPKMIFYECIWEDYLVWQKYQNLFPLKKFIFRVYKSPYSKKHCLFLFINKESVTKIFDVNEHLFKQKLGSDMTSKELLRLLEEKEDIVEEVFHGNEDLLGILLGFGKHNSQVYQKREELDKIKGSPPFDFDKLKEIYTINLVGFPHDDKQNDTLLNFIQLPYYVEEKKHPESVLIRKKYMREQKKLCEIYSHGNFFETTMKALIGKDQ